MKVTLLASTPNPTLVCSVAASTCTNVAPIFKENRNMVERVMDYGHESIAEHVSFTFVVEGVSLSCTHQLVRHRIASYSQKSGRAVEGLPQFVFDFPLMPLSADRMEKWHIETGELYEQLLSEGVPQEEARKVWPVGSATNIVITKNARSLRHLFRERLCKRAQPEIFNMAMKMFTLAVQAAPSLFNGDFPDCKNCTERSCKF